MQRCLNKLRNMHTKEMVLCVRLYSVSMRPWVKIPSTHIKARHGYMCLQSQVWGTRVGEDWPEARWPVSLTKMAIWFRRASGSRQQGSCRGRHPISSFGSAGSNTEECSHTVKCNHHIHTECCQAWQCSTFPALYKLRKEDHQFKDHYGTTWIQCQPR